MGEKVIVTGGAGFVGSHLCESLVRDDHYVVCVDNLGSGRRSNIEHLLSNDYFDFINVDIRDKIDLPACDQLYHLASRASPKDFTRFPVQIALTNTQGTMRLLEHATECDARMLYASTSEIYGDPEVHPQPESYTGNVNIRGPRGCYDESKRFGETLTVAYMNQYDIDVRTARIFNTYGPRMRADDGRVVPTFINQALTGQDLTIYGDGTQTRSFCYISDLVRGLRTFMNSPDLRGEVINIGSENEKTIKTLATSILEWVETDSTIEYEPLPEDDPRRRQPDLAKARRLLQWEPKVPFSKGIKQTIDHFEH